VEEERRPLAAALPNNITPNEPEATIATAADDAAKFAIPDPGLADSWHEAPYRHPKLVAQRQREWARDRAAARQPSYLRDFDPYVLLPSNEELEELCESDDPPVEVAEWKEAA
jgi:hypothetical protein